MRKEHDVQANENEVAAYLVDKDYRILSMNEACQAMFPDAKLGDFCYQAAGWEKPCEKCPIWSEPGVLYNENTDKWYAVSAGRLELPQLGTCYSVHIKNSALSADGARYSSAAMATMPGGYYCCAAAEGYPLLHVSERFLEITGWSKDELKYVFDNKFKNMMWEDDMDILEHYLEVLDQTDKVEGQFRLKCKGGGYRWVQGAAVCVHVDDHKFYQSVLSDVTDFIENELRQREELEEARRKAEAASEAKTTFLLNMSHDIRTPMNAIRGFSQMAQRHINDKKQVLHCLDQQTYASEHLMRLINNVLDMARIETGRADFNIQPHHIPTELKKLYSIFEQDMQGKHISFSIQHDLTDEVAFYDNMRMNQVELNLIGNALKYTPEGGKITYRVRQLGIQHGYAVYEGTVRDNGIGMSEEFCRHAFEVFERERTETAVTEEGSGLGLSITKRLLNQMGGGITCRSEQGKGSEFIFTVRFRAGTAQDMPKRAAQKTLDQRLHGRRILLAEDNALNREIAFDLLESEGIVVECAEDGAIALDKLQKAPENYYDMILMDVQMPNMDGYEATRRIRSLPDSRARIPIAAMTANAFEQDRQKAFAAGMDKHISKPVDLNELNQIMCQMLDENEA